MLSPAEQQLLDDWLDRLATARSHATGASNGRISVAGGCETEPELGAINGEGRAASGTGHS